MPRPSLSYPDGGRPVGLLRTALSREVAFPLKPREVLFHDHPLPARSPAGERAHHFVQKLFPQLRLSSVSSYTLWPF